jgi:hypothetical protein
MGMFDEVICEYPLPDDLDFEDHPFQTKDLNCNLDQYTLTHEGKLVLSRICGDHFDPGCGIRTGNEIDVNYTGTITIYTYLDSEIQIASIGYHGKPAWYEYNVTLVDGYLVKIEPNHDL